MKRKERDSKVSKHQLLVPIDVTKFGSKEDPCFGKLYSLTAEECLMCGDHELCAIAFQNLTTTKRLEYEKKHPVLDMELSKLEYENDIKTLIIRLSTRGFSRSLIKTKVKAKFRLKTEIVNKYINKWMVKTSKKRRPRSGKAKAS